MKKKVTAWALAAVLGIQCVVPAFGAQIAGLDEYSVIQSPVEEYVSAIVELEDSSVLGSGLALGTEEADARREELLAQQERVLEEIRFLTGNESIESEYRYTALANGFAVEIPSNALEAIGRIDGVAKVYRSARFCAPETDGLETEAGGQVMSTAEMIGAEDAWAMGYDGTGMVVAVIDTGLDTDHPSFAGDLDETKLGLTQEEVAEVLENLNASQTCAGMTAENVYYNNKVPFAFNYADNSLYVGHAYDLEGDHGTHVAGIIAANDLEETQAVGIAPEAQVVAMKVFGAGHEGVPEEVLVAAVEDAVVLGCDVINMSFGSITGFSGEDMPLLMEAIGRAEDAGVVFCAAAGNDYYSAYGNLTGTNLPAADDVDVGLVSMPASLPGVMAVGSVESVGRYITGFRVCTREGEELVAEYSDTGNQFGLELFSTLAGHTYEFAAVPGIGSVEDVAAVMLEGKIAVISRGEITFAEKARNAFDAGAVAVVICNHTDEEVIMDLTELTGQYSRPCVIVDRETGALLLEAGQGTLTVLAEPQLVQAEGGRLPSVYSSWGVLSDLTLKPEFSGVGGNVYSALDGGEYGVMSGTSMATPQVAGAAILALQYVKEAYALDPVQARDVAVTLLMNTAVPAVQENGAEYSPRKQGAGLVDVAGALSAPVYLEVEGSELPKAELGDDPARKGNYQFTVTAHDLSGSEQRFVPSMSVLTETEWEGSILMSAQSLEAEINFSSESGGLSYLYDLDGNGALEVQDADVLSSWTERERRALNAEYFDFNADQRIDLLDVELLKAALGGIPCEMDINRVVLTVPAGGELTFEVSIDLPPSSRLYLENTFENGIYVEGYLRLGGVKESSASLSVPMLAFYGDWSQAPLFETLTLPESVAEETVGNGLYPLQVVTGISSYLGMNPVFTDKTYIERRSNALNTSGGEGGVISDLYFSLLRDARRLTVDVIDDSGEVIYTSSAEYVSKSCYTEEAGTILPTAWSAIAEEFAPFVPGSYGLGDGDTFTLRLSGEKMAEGPNGYEEICIPVYVDGTAPEIRDISVARGLTLDSFCHVTVSVRDNFFVSSLALMDAEGKQVLARYEVDQKVKGGLTRVTLDVTEYLPLIGGSFTIGVIDYAQNVTVRDISVVRDNDTTILPEEELFFYGSYYGDQAWYTAGGEEEASAPQKAFLDYYGNITAAEYVDGYLIAAQRHMASRLQMIDTRTFLSVSELPLPLLNDDDTILDMEYRCEEEMLYLLARCGEDYVILRTDLLDGTTELMLTLDENRIAGFRRACALAGWSDGSLSIAAAVEHGDADKEQVQLYVLDEGQTLTYAGELGVFPVSGTMSAVFDPEEETLYYSHYSRVYDKVSGQPQEVSAIYALELEEELSTPRKLQSYDSLLINALIWTAEP